MAREKIDTGPLAAEAARLAGEGKSALFAAVDGRLAAVLAIADAIKPTTPAALDSLRALGLRLGMLTGDAAVNAGVAGVENTRSAISVEQVKAWCAGTSTKVTIRPVIDLKALRDDTAYRAGIERKRVAPGLITEVLGVAADASQKDITKAFIYSYKEQAETLFQNYLDHAEAYVTKSRVRDPNTREELQPDEAFLKSIEEQIAIIGSAADGFRQEVIAYLWASSRRGEKITYSAYEPLKEAIERKRGPAAMDEEVLVEDDVLVSER